MANDNKAVGPLASARLVTLIKAETAKKLDKTGGTLTGDLTISGAWLNVKSTDTGDGNISVDGSLVSGRGVSVLNDDKYVSLVCTGDNAAKIAGSGNNCARLAVGTPAGDNDAATKAYVDSKSAVVDAALDAGSANPVQNKVVKAALDGKLSTRGGEISASLRVGQTVSAEGSVSVGRTSTDTGIHFEKAASDAGRISHGSDPMTGVSPIARLKVASPTEDDDAATKAYVDNNAAGAGAVRYDAAQTLDEAQQAQARENVGAASAFAPILTSPVMIRKFGETESAGVYLSTIDTGEKHAEIRLEDVNENAPVAIANLRTPTGAGKDDYAATKGYVDSKALPAVTTADNGKILKVVNGAWQAVSPD